MEAEAEEEGEGGVSVSMHHCYGKAAHGKT